MLSSATDYTCLDLTGLEGFVKGDIYPVRKAREDGSYRALKYEDLLYLHEAKLKRENYANSTFTKQKPYGRNLSNGAFKDVASFSILNNHVLKEGWDLSGTKSITTNGYSYYSGIAFMIESGAFTSVNVSNETPHRFLSNSNVEEAYENIKKTVRVRRPGVFTFLDSYTMNGKAYGVNSSSFLIGNSGNGYEGDRRYFASAFFPPYTYGQYIGCKKAYLPLATSWGKNGVSHHTLHIFSCEVLSGSVLAPNMRSVLSTLRNDMDSMPDGAGLYMIGSQTLILDFDDCDF